nr:hypothetical protein [Streptomyces antibioticus]
MDDYIYDRWRRNPGQNPEFSARGPSCLGCIGFVLAVGFVFGFLMLVFR